jgi:hypothetical protein
VCPRAINLQEVEEMVGKKGRKQMRKRIIQCGIVTMFLGELAVGQAQVVTVSAVQTFQPATWTAAGEAPGEAQSTVIRYVSPGGSTTARILIASDTLPYAANSPFVPTGTVAYQDIGGAVQSSTFQVPPGCAVPFSTTNPTCDWDYISNDHDIVSTPGGTVYYMPGVGYKGPSTAGSQPPWFLGGPNSNKNATSRGSFGPNARSALAVWKSTDQGQTFQWSSYFDPTAYFGGSCAYPQYRNPTESATGYIGAAPWDMGGSDGQSAWTDPMTGTVFLTFQCVGYQPTPGRGSWTLTTNADGSAANSKVNATILASFDGNNWTPLAFPQQVAGWRIGAIPYNQFLLLGFLSNVMIADTTKSQAPLVASYPSYWVPSNWPNPLPKPSFLAVAVLYPNVLARWGTSGYAFAYATNNAAAGATPIYGYTLDYFSLPPAAQAVSGTAPNPQWGDAPILINPTDPSGFVTDPVAIDVGSGTTLLYWYDVNPNFLDPTVTIRGRLLLEGGQASNDIVITPTPFSVKGGGVHFWGDYKTAGGYCSNYNGNITTVFYPMWTDVGNGTAQYAEVSATVPAVAGAVISSGCRQPPATNRLDDPRRRDMLASRQVALQLTKPQRLTPGRLGEGTVDQLKVPRPDVDEHRPAPLEKLRELTPKPQ